MLLQWLFHYTKTIRGQIVIVRVFRVVTRQATVRGANAPGTAAYTIPQLQKVSRVWHFRIHVFDLDSS